MITFWILAAGLMALAILFAVVPLIRDPLTSPATSQEALNLQVFRGRLEELEADRAAGFLDETQHTAARHDLERELLSDLGSAAREAPTAALTKPKLWEGRAPILALALSVALPTAAVLAYLKLGNGPLLPTLEAAASQPGGGGGDGEAGALASLETMAQGLAAKLAKDPSNLDGWIMLGRTYASMGQPAKALDALEQAYKLAPRDADVIVAYAQAVAANAGNRLDGRPAELIRSALEIQPDNIGALSLGGMVDFQAGRFAEAIKAWETVLAKLDPSAEEVEQVRQVIAEARRRAGLPAPAEPAAAPAPPAGQSASAVAQEPTPGGAEQASAPASAGAKIRVKVSLAPELVAASAPEDTLYVFARAAEGPPMPLAVKRLKVSDLPTELTLDDSMAMSPGLRLSAFPNIVVGARISKSGQATPSSGDLEGQTEPVVLADTPEVQVAIDRKRP
jgi:cytochrome c-type biogenesis protein CcmH